MEHSAMCEAEQSLAGDGPTPHCDEIYSLTTRVTASPATVSQNEGILLANLFHRYNAEIYAEFFPGLGAFKAVKCGAKF